MAKKTNGVRIAALIFALVAFCASTCQMTCAAGICPNQTHQGAGHECGQNPGHRSQDSRQPGQQPGGSDCAGHQHSDLFLGASGSFPSLALNVAADIHVPAPVMNSGVDFTFHFEGAKVSDLAPPLRSVLPIYQKNSDLRI